MTTISNLNIVVQHGGDSVKEVQNLRNPQMDPSQVTPGQQTEKETEKRETVETSEEEEKIRADHEGSGSGGGHRKSAGEKGKHQQEDAEKDPEAPGRLLDTIA